MATGYILVFLAVENDNDFFKPVSGNLLRHISKVCSLGQISPPLCITVPNENFR